MTPHAKHLTNVAPLAITLALLAACSDQPSPTGPAAVARPPAAVPSLTGVSPGSIVLDTKDLGYLGNLGIVLDRASINELGVTAAAFINSVTPYAFVWLDGQLRGFGPDGGLFSPSNILIEAWDVTNANMVVGSKVGMRSIGLPTNNYPAVWENGAFRELQLPELVDGFLVYGAVVRGANDMGRGVGQLYFESSAAPNHAVMWNLATGTMQDLGTLGGVAANGMDVNDRGDIAANRQNASGSHVALAVRGTYPNLSVQELGDLGGHSSTATALNELGQIAGGATKADGRTVPFVWDPGTGVMKELTTGSSAGGMILGMNDLGQSVGYLAGRQPALWQDGEVYPLGDADLRAAAYDINNDGQVSGQVFDPATAGYHAVIWTVPLHPTIDVAPGDASNAIPLGSKGIVTVAVLTTPYMDASRVVSTSLTLGNADANDAPVMVKRDGSPSVVFKDLDHDGDQDLVAQFDKDVLKQKGDLTTATTRLVLRGQLRNGKQLRASNAVTVSP